MRNRCWTEDEDYIVLCKDLSIEDKADLLNRTVCAIRNRHIRLTNDKYSKDKWNNLCREQRHKRNPEDISRSNSRVKWEPTEDELLMNSNLSDDQIAKELGRSISAIVGRRYKLLHMEECDYDKLYSYS